MKPIIYHTKNFNSLNPFYLESFISQYIELKPYESGQDYKNCNILISMPYKETLDNISESTLDNCQYIIIDNLQESFYYGLEKIKPWAKKVILLTGGYQTDHEWPNVINIPDWFWYFEALWWISYGYDSYVPNLVENPKLFFMPMRRKKLGRTMIYNKLKDHLDDSIYSYLENGVELPGIPDDQKEDQRYFNPDWYNSTLFSVVNEDSDDREAKIWTEKTCKPLAFFHPFILVAQQGVLNMITSAGFQSFPELFDESYDYIPDLENRVQFVYEQIINVDRSRLRSSEIKEKLVYNRNRFFDTTLIYNRLTEKLMVPLVEYLND